MDGVFCDQIHTFNVCDGFSQLKPSQEWASF